VIAATNPRLVRDNTRRLEQPPGDLAATADHHAAVRPNRRRGTPASRGNSCSARYYARRGLGFGVSGIDDHADLAIMPTLMLDHLRGRRMRHQRVGITQLVRLSRRHPLGEKESSYPRRARALQVCGPTRSSRGTWSSLPRRATVMPTCPTGSLAPHGDPDRSRHNREVGMTVVMPTSALRRIPSGRRPRLAIYLCAARGLADVHCVPSPHMRGRPRCCPAVGTATTTLLITG
jgi:hypothetical protein